MIENVLSMEAKKPANRPTENRINKIDLMRAIRSAVRRHTTNATRYHIEYMGIRKFSLWYRNINTLFPMTYRKIRRMIELNDRELALFPK